MGLRCQRAKSLRDGARINVMLEAEVRGVSSFAATTRRLLARARPGTGSNTGSSISSVSAS